MNPALKTALEYAARGFYVFPLKPGSKYPYKGFSWKKLSTNDPLVIKSAGRFEKYKNANWAVDCGKSGLFVIDIDMKNGKDGAATLISRFSNITSSFLVQTPSDGMHMYYKGTGPSSVEKLLGPGLDTRGTGGYVLIPGSVRNGKSYRNTRDSGKLFPIPDEIAKVLGEAPKKKENKSVPACDLDLIENIDRVISYLNIEAEQAVEGTGGDQTTYEVCCRVRDFGISEAKAFELIEIHWNREKAFPPWSLDDLENKVRNAYTYARDVPGNATPAAMFSDSKESKEGMSKPSQGINAVDLLNKDLPPTRWVVEDLLPVGLGVLAGRPKLGKSWTALQLSIAVSLADSFLGFSTRQSQVAYMGLEDSFKRLQDRLGRMLSENDPSVDLLIYNDWRPLDKGGLEDIEKVYSDNKDVGLIIIDTWQKIRPVQKPKGANAYEVDYAEAGKLKRLADKHNSHILLIHHLRKSTAGMGSDIFERVNGSSGITAAADVLMILERHRNVADAELHISGRDINEGVHLLARNQETLGWDRIGGPDSVARTIEQQKILVNLKILKKASPKDISEKTGLALQYVKNTLPKLAFQGLITKVEHGKYEPVEMFEGPETGLSDVKWL